ncbi:MAG TPA: hypothetical protein EYP57_06385 [Thermodesulfobacteriaceae bacterium]|nr:hypothetical protein [Thermodesulfobacteriaceae bacterium]
MMGNLKKKSAAAIITLAMFCLPAVSMAWHGGGPGNCGNRPCAHGATVQGQSDCQCADCDCQQRKGCMGQGQGGCQCGDFQNRSEYLKKTLELDDNQMTLLGDMHNSFRELRKTAIQNSPADAETVMQARKTMKRTHFMFRAEVNAPDPDFETVRNRLKTEYAGSHPELYNRAVDARAAFLSSLSGEQLDKFSMMRPPHRRR